MLFKKGFLFSLETVCENYEDGTIIHLGIIPKMFCIWIHCIWAGTTFNWWQKYLMLQRMEKASRF